MARSQQSFNKKEVQQKKDKKRKEKEKRKLERKEGEKKSSLDDMIAWVDENGQIVDTPPDLTKKSKIKAEDIEVSVRRSEDKEEEDFVRKGTVSFFNDAKGFGFIRDSQTKDSIFVHINNTIDEIKEGNAVLFETEKGPKGLMAVRVKLDK